MLLVPRCIRSFTSSRHTLCLEIVFWSFLTKTKQDQVLSSHFHGKSWPHRTEFCLGFVCQFFGDILYSTLQCNVCLEVDHKRGIKRSEIYIVQPSNLWGSFESKKVHKLSYSTHLQVEMWTTWEIFVMSGTKKLVFKILSFVKVAILSVSVIFTLY